MLTLENIQVTVQAADGHLRPVLRHISTRLNAATCTGLLGRNGAGKTTLARLLSGLEQPDSGHIQRPARTRIMHVFQRSEDHFTRERVMDELTRYISGTFDYTVAYEYLEAVNLDRDIARQPLRHLSQGTRRLVTIACGLATRPDWLILDEPLSGLDARNRQQVRRALHRLSQQQTGLLIISHHPDDLLGLVQQLWILHEGELLYDGAFESAPVSALQQVFVDNGDSVYLHLRHLDEAGILPSSRAYRALTDDELQAILHEELGS